MKRLFFSLIALFAISVAAIANDENNVSVDVNSFAKSLQENGLPAELKKKTAEELTSTIIKLLPKYSNKANQIKELNDITLKLSQPAPKSRAKQDDAPTPGYTQLMAALMEALANAGIDVSDWDYIQNTLLPLYFYTMEGRTPPEWARMNYRVDTLFHTPTDGCYYGIGDERNTYDPYGLTYEECRECKENGGKLKKNGAYTWGMTQVGDKIFIGTVNNILCMPSWQSMTSFGAGEPYENNCWVCQYGQGTRKDAGMSGDMERPRVYMMDIYTGVAQDITPNDPVLDDCLGLRSAANHNGVIFLGGPGLDSDAGQTSTKSAFLAFDEDGNLLGTSDMSDVDGFTVTDVRRWVVVDGVLYCGVAIADPTKTGPDGKPLTKGAILRWYGDKTDPFKFHIVGYTANEAGEICYHKGRLYVGGWPTNNLQVPAIFQGPEVPEGGLTPEDAQEWQVRWTMAQYEPNAMNLQMNQCSLLRSYKGKLYWSMWYVQYGLPLSLTGYLGLDMSTPKGVAAFLAMLRQATLWRTDDFSEVELVYGEEKLPDYDFMKGEIVQPRYNKGKYKPLYGRAGFDRQFTSYMWASEEYQGHMFIGTMSIEQLIEPAMSNTGDESMQNTLNLFVNALGVNEDHKGYEFYMFKDNETPAVTITEDAFGNHSQYGIRNIVKSPDDRYMYLGTASPMNLSEFGGFQVLRFQDRTKYPDGIEEVEMKQTGVMVKKENGYVTVSSLLGEKVKKVTVTDVAGRVVKVEVPVNKVAYLFPEQIGNGIYVLNIETETDSYTTKVTL